MATNFKISLDGVQVGLAVALLAASATNLVLVWGWL